jgi:hypothetical protein
MKEQTQELVKKSEQDCDISVGVTDALTYGIIHTRVLKSNSEEIHHTPHGKKYISGPNKDGNVRILPDLRVSDAYLVESRGKMDLIDDFMKKDLVRILSDEKAADQGQEEGYGTSCG